jgi:hypothetical protein
MEPEPERTLANQSAHESHEGVPPCSTRAAGPASAAALAEGGPCTWASMSNWNGEQAATWIKSKLAATWPDFNEQPLIDFFHEEDFDGDDLAKTLQKRKTKRLQKGLSLTLPSAEARAQALQLLLSVKVAAAGPKNIEQQLAEGRSAWQGHKAHTNSAWWQTDIAESVLCLQTAARVRDSVPREWLEDAPNMQLLVMGDTSTGKSTVLNRFAEFTFSAVKDGVCTRRPVRLQLRPLSAQNRATFDDEKLLSMCTVTDTRDNHEEHFKLRKAHRMQDENELRLAVERRASAQAAGDTQESYDQKYIEQELVIRIEANQMIFFDLVDLPGLENASPMPLKMLRKYLNRDTLANTFVFLCTPHEAGDTELKRR